MFVLLVLKAEIQSPHNRHRGRSKTAEASSAVALALVSRMWQRVEHPAQSRGGWLATGLSSRMSVLWIAMPSALVTARYGLFGVQSHPLNLHRVSASINDDRLASGLETHS